MSTINNVTRSIETRRRGAGKFAARSAKQRSLFLVPCAVATLAGTAWSQTIYPGGGATKTVTATASGNDPNGFWYGSASNSATGLVTGSWAPSVEADAVDPILGVTLASAQTKICNGNFLAGDGHITDGYMDLLSTAIGYSPGSGAPVDQLGTGNSSIDGRFQIGFTVSEPTVVTLGVEMTSIVATDPAIDAAGADVTFSGLAVGAEYHVYGSSAGPSSDGLSESNTFVLYPNGLYTFTAHVYGSADAELSAVEAGVEATGEGYASWNMGDVTSGFTIGTYNPAPTSGSVNYNSPGSWTTVPNGACQIAYFPQAPVPQTISLDVDVTVGTVTIDSTNAYTINGPGTLTIYCPADGGHLNVLNGNHTINASTTLESDTTVDIVHAADSLTMTALQPSTSINVTKVDAGTWTVNALALNSLTINGGTVRIADQASADTLSTVNSLSIPLSGGGPVGTLDLRNNALTISYGSGPDPIATVQALLTSGYNGGAWNGSGITSATAAARAIVGPTTDLGYADDGAGNVNIVYTLGGDADLDGTVDVIDFNILGTYFGDSGTDWAQGDFNYDGTTDIQDFNILAANYGASIGATPDASVTGGSDGIDFSPLAAFAAAHDDTAEFDAILEARGISVPEPSCLGLLAISGVGLLRRRRGRVAK
jgi:hypothetical protein